VKLKVLLIGTLSILFVGVFYIINKSDISDNKSEQDLVINEESRPLEKVESHIVNNIDAIPFSQEEEVTRVVDKQVLAKGDKSKEPRIIDEVWKDINPSESLGAIKPKSPYVESIKAIEFQDVLQFRALNQGDQINITLPDNSNIEIQVESNEFQNEGIRTWSGGFTIDKQNYPVTFTFGKDSILGFIGHPDGQIKIEGAGNSAWVYEVPPNHGFDN